MLTYYIIMQPMIYNCSVILVAHFNQNMFYFLFYKILVDLSQFEFGILKIYLLADTKKKQTSSMNIQIR